MYFAGKLVYLIVLPSNQLAIMCPSISVLAITKMSNITEICNIRAIRVIFLEIILLKAVI